jgi:hypothetical protein
MVHDEDSIYHSGREEPAAGGDRIVELDVYPDLTTPGLREAAFPHLMLIGSMRLVSKLVRGRGPAFSRNFSQPLVLERPYLCSLHGETVGGTGILSPMSLKEKSGSYAATTS